MCVCVYIYIYIYIYMYTGGRIRERGPPSKLKKAYPTNRQTTQAFRRVEHPPCFGACFLDFQGPGPSARGACRRCAGTPCRFLFLFLYFNLISLSLYIYICICIYVCMYVCMYVCIYIYTYVCMCIYIYIYIRFLFTPISFSKGSF